LTRIRVHCHYSRANGQRQDYSSQFGCSDSIIPGEVVGFFCNLNQNGKGSGTYDEKWDTGGISADGAAGAAQ
jgi:hypothetical protein